MRPGHARAVLLTACGALLHAAPRRLDSHPTQNLRHTRPCRPCLCSCFAEYIDDGECDKACNRVECRWDGADCTHGHDECYERADGADYRGALNVTASGRACQRWSAQFPQQHFFTHARYPGAGLGAHSACRNPGGVNEGVWCYTMEPGHRWELCALPLPAERGCTSRNPHHQVAHAHGPSACGRLCPEASARIAQGECEPSVEHACIATAEALLMLNATSSGDACASERRACAMRRATSERLQIVIWLALAGTSTFVLALLAYAYRLTSPMGSPRAWSAACGGGYTGLPFATPGTAALQAIDAHADEGDYPSELARAQRERERELLEAAEQAVLVE